MNLSQIKRGNILVAQYPDATAHKRDFIIFIASGCVTMNTFVWGDLYYNIETIAHIDLQQGFTIGGEIGFIGESEHKENLSTLRRPTINEMLELNVELKKHGYRYNRKTKNIEKRHD